MFHGSGKSKRRSGMTLNRLAFSGIPVAAVARSRLRG
jgi:hypothetical protein